MANEEHLGILRQGVDLWNVWRANHPEVVCPDLAGANLRTISLIRANFHGANLAGVNLTQAVLTQANLQGANLRGANFHKAFLQWTDLRGADLVGASFTETFTDDIDFQEAKLLAADFMGARLVGSNFCGADLTRAKLQKANLMRANLCGANLYDADVRDADLTGATFTKATLTRADLTGATLYEADLTGATFYEANFERVGLIRTMLDQTVLTGCKVYGLSVWDIRGTPKDQSSLIITPSDMPTITVDDLEVAQFIYLLLNREKLRNVINTITSKAVLILGRFTPERKAVLDAMADELRTHNLLPIIFDFEGATTRDITETIKTLAGLSLFVIADITNPKSAPLEWQATVPDYHIPFIPIIQEGEDPFSMFRDLSIYPWMLTPVITYPSVEKLLQGFKQGIIDRAWAKHQELVKQKNQALETQSIEDFVREGEG